MWSKPPVEIGDGLALRAGRTRDLEFGCDIRTDDRLGSTDHLGHRAVPIGAAHAIGTNESTQESPTRCRRMRGGDAADRRRARDEDE